MGLRISRGTRGRSSDVRNMKPIKSRFTPQLHRAGRQAGTIKPVRGSGWEWAGSLLQQQRAAWAGCTCAGARMGTFLSFSVARVSPILSPPRSAASRNCKSYPPGYMKQAPSRGHEASPQSGLGAGCKLCSSSKKLRGLSVRAQARRIRISLSFSVVWGFLVSVFPA